MQGAARQPVYVVMNCHDARRHLGGLDGATSDRETRLALRHARDCPRCRALALRLADAVLTAAGDEIPCAECGAQLDRLAVAADSPRIWARLDAAMPGRVRAHLAACPDCAAELRLLERMLAAGAALAPAAAPGPPPVAFDTSFLVDPPPDDRRAVPPFWAPWLRALRDVWSAPGASARRSQAGLAALTAVLLFSLARLVVMDASLRESLEDLAPFGPPAATEDPESRRAADRATAAARPSATPGAAGLAPATRTATSRAATVSPPTASATPTGTPLAPAAEEERSERDRAGAPATGAPPPESDPTEEAAPYPPPDDPPPTSASGGGGELPDPGYPGPEEPGPDPTATSAP